MYDARSIAFIARAAEAISSEGTQWIEVMPTVERDRNGPWYWTITREDLETYAADIRSRPGQIPIDYDHAEGTTGTMAAGWFTGEAEVREDADGSARLWAQVKWTSRAREAIEDGQWKRISPEFSFRERDPKTGLLTKAKEFIAATLTNRPHFEQLSAVTARELLESGDLDELGALYGPEAARLIVSALGGDVEAVRAAIPRTQEQFDELPDSTKLGLYYTLADRGVVRL